MRTRILMLMACGIVFLAHGVGAQYTPDFTVTISDLEDPVNAGSTVDFDVHVANVGTDGDPDVGIHLDIYLPMGVPVPWQEYLDADDTARQAIVDAFLVSAEITVDDNIWNDDLSYIYVGQTFNNGCESMMIQPQHLVLPGGTSGSIHFQAELPSSGGVSGVAYDTPTGERVEVNYGVGGCFSNLFDDCQGIPCMGPRLTMIPTDGAPVSLVDDGTDPVGDGCEDFSATFPAGHVALIDRGTCLFADKALNATNAGAAGVIIANTEALGSVTPTVDSIMVMGCNEGQCHSSTITIPAAFFSYNSGEALKAAMDQGAVTVYMGIRDEEPEYKQTKARIWEFPGEAVDVDTDNNRTTEKTTIALFADGFESGGTGGWSDVAGG